MLPSELTNTFEQFIVYAHWNETHVTYICVCNTNVFEADNIYKNPPPNIISPKMSAIFRFGAPPMTLLTAIVESPYWHASQWCAMPIVE